MAPNFTTSTMDFCFLLTSSATIDFCDCTELSKQISLINSITSVSHTRTSTQIHEATVWFALGGTKIDHIFQRPKTTVASNSILHIEFDYEGFVLLDKLRSKHWFRTFCYSRRNKLWRKKKESIFVWIRMCRVHISQPKGWNFYRTLNFIIFHAHNIWRRVKPS